jgi:ABC-type antimicrobial peptide transport system permease subunit
MVSQRKTAAMLAVRSVKEHKVRYIAILLIVLLSVGFFSGLKVTKDQMWDAAGRYFDDQNLYDYRIYSSMGFTDEEIDEFSDMNPVGGAEGAYSADVLMTFEKDTEEYLVMSIPENINKPSLTSGRMPENQTECLADHRAFSEDDIGKTITVSHDNDSSAENSLTEETYTITGLVNSPLYISSYRGSSASGTCEYAGFIYVPAENFTSAYYTEADIVLDDDLKKGEASEAFSSAYDKVISSNEDEIRNKAQFLADKRYNEILSAMTNSLTGSLTPISHAGSQEPEIYVLTRDENSGYSGFQSDTSIINSIADIFPMFFILIALLVCITTMLRMVEEERGQIGTLKAIGYSDRSIALKYLYYAGSAAFTGWAAGFFGGTYFLPRVFWAAYSSLYDFTSIEYVFDPSLAVITLVISLLSILVGTDIAVLRELRSTPASLIRPKSAKPGKRILLERITPLWKKFSFLGKATIRNMFRYKIRMIMMLVGIGCSSALIIMGFGVRDSMINLGSQQYDDVQKYQIEVTIDTNESSLDTILDQTKQTSHVKEVISAETNLVDVKSDSSSMDSVHIYAFSSDTDLSHFWNISSLSDGSTDSIPETGKALVSKRLSEKLDLQNGTAFTVNDSSNKGGSLETEDAFVNYVKNYIFVNTETYEELFGENESDTLLITTDNLSNSEEQSLCEELGNIEGVTSVTRLSEDKASVDKSVSCLNYIIWLIVAFAGALSFIVIFNLTNINLEERSREIATVEVLGFYRREVRFYVLRENVVLSAIAAVIGMPLGWFGTRAVMGRILLDNLTYEFTVKPVDYLLSFACTIVFAMIANLFMRRRIRKINMAESLKAVE